jgi:hypothetical protein
MLIKIWLFYALKQLVIVITRLILLVSIGPSVIAFRGFYSLSIFKTLSGVFDED